MQKRPCGKTGLDFTVIGFGAMRLHGPDTARWAALVREAAQGGFNYFETSHRYCGSTSEIKVGEGLKGFPREKVYISTKSSADDFVTADAVRKVIDESLKKLQVEYLDFYQLWGLSLKDWTEIATKKGGTLEGIRKAMDEGLIRHLGFTSHDTPENMIALLRTGEFESVTLQYNLINRVNEPVIAEAGRLGIGVVVMGPLHGGLLGTPSAVLDELFGEGATDAAAEAAFRFVLSNPNVTSAISGMTTPEDVRQNKAIAERAKPLAAKEMERIDGELRKFMAAAESLCTGCRYCMPCAQGVGIFAVLKLANAARIYGLVEGSRQAYSLFDKEWPYEDFKDASHCTACGECLAKCPQKIDIPAELKKAHEILK
jgi:predicted aldo/keto reductase-like oxidoreductase